MPDPAADSDNDGSSNQLEYELGRAPNLGEPPLVPITWTDAGTGNKHLARTSKRAKGTRVVAEISDDLVTWLSAGAQLVQVGTATTDTTGIYETVTFLSTATLAAKPRQFLRVRVTAP